MNHKGKKIEKLPIVQKGQPVIWNDMVRKVNEIIDSLETHTVKEELTTLEKKIHCFDCGAQTMKDCIHHKEEVATPEKKCCEYCNDNDGLGCREGFCSCHDGEKKCCEKCQRMGRRNDTPTVYDVPLTCTSNCPCHQGESEK